MSDADKLAEFEPLHLPARSMERLAELLDEEANGTISSSDLARLNGIREAARYLPKTSESKTEAASDLRLNFAGT